MIGYRRSSASKCGAWPCLVTLGHSQSCTSSGRTNSHHPRGDRAWRNVTKHDAPARHLSTAICFTFYGVSQKCMSVYIPFQILNTFSLNVNVKGSISYFSCSTFDSLAQDTYFSKFVLFIWGGGDIVHSFFFFCLECFFFQTLWIWRKKKVILLDFSVFGTFFFRKFIKLFRYTPTTYFSVEFQYLHRVKWVSHV